MELSSRLSKIASMVDYCDRVADIGTDHAYIPIALIKEGKCKEAIASDINEGPLEKAINNVKLEDLEGKIECRLGGGLSTIKPSEAQVAIIAGMGGNLIRDIINENTEVFKSLEYCVVQPVQNPEVLREFIYKMGFDIIDEELVIEENKYYEILKIGYNNNKQQVDPIYYEVGKKLIDKKHYLIEKFLTYKLHKYKSIYDRLNDDSFNSQRRKVEVLNKIHSLKGLLDLCH